MLVTDNEDVIGKSSALILVQFRSQSIAMHEKRQHEAANDSAAHERSALSEDTFRALFQQGDWVGAGVHLFDSCNARLIWLLSLSLPRTALIVIAVFILDWLTPLGISICVLYMAAVLSAVPIRHRWAIVMTGAVCSILVLVGWAISPGRGDTELWKVLLNRVLALGVIGAAIGVSQSWRRLQQRRSKQLQESRLLHQVTALAAFEGSFQEALQNSVKVLSDIFGWPVAHVYLKDAEGRHLSSSDTWNLPEDGRFALLKTATMGVRFAPGEGAAGHIWKTGESIAVADVSQSPFYTWLQEPQRLGVKGAFAFPLVVNGEVAAVLEFFSEDEIRLESDFTALAGTIGQQLGRLFERRRADLALRRSEERLRLALAGGQMGTWEWQIDNGRVIWSPELERIHGLEPGEFAGTFEASIEAIYPDDRDGVSNAIKRAVEAQDDYHCEYRILRPDGEVQWLEGRGAVHAGADGQARRMVGVCMDVTQRKQVEVETRRAKDAAETANQLRSQFLANVSHELRTPMSAVLGMLQLSLAERELSNQMRENLETAKRSADSLLVLLNDVLDFSRIEGNGLRIERTTFDLRKLLDDSIRPLAARAFENGLELIYDVAADVPNFLVGDADRLRQVITNLVVNGIKFTDRGEVVVEVKLQQQLPGEARIKFNVRDTGLGISPADQLRIFQPFMQADASATRRYGGVGLGLSISSELVRLMGGRLEVESELQAGSQFYFTLTLPLSDKQQDVASRTPDRGNLQSLSVLVVDDNETCRNMLVETLRSWSMEPEAAIDADHALGKAYRAEAEGRSFRLVVADAHMPVMAGEELLRQMDEDFDCAPPVLLLRAGDQPSHDALANRKTRTALLDKPVSPSMLFDAIMSLLDFEPAQHASAANNGDDELAQDALSVLVVEDTPANQKVVGSILRKRGHQVTVAPHGGEALRLLVAGAGYDVILMDVQMPVMDGYEATAEIRKLERKFGWHIPIVAMTAHAMEGDREKCLAAGMDTYLTKPIDVQRLIEVVESIASDDAKSETPSATPSPKHDGPINIDATLARLGGDRELLAEFVAIFQSDAPQLVRDLEEAVAQQDATVVERTAHSLKGLAANIGATGVADQADELERRAANGSRNELTATLSHLKTQMQLLNGSLTNLLASLA